jgi:hypothetical protein
VKGDGVLATRGRPWRRAYKYRCGTPEMRWVDSRAKEALEWARNGGPIAPQVQAPKPGPSRPPRSKGLLRRLLRWIWGG